MEIYHLVFKDGMNSYREGTKIRYKDFQVGMTINQDKLKVSYECGQNLEEINLEDGKIKKFKIYSEIPKDAINYFKEAIKKFIKAINISSSNFEKAQAYYFMGRTLQHMGVWEEAIKFYKKACSLDGKFENSTKSYIDKCLKKEF